MTRTPSTMLTLGTQAPDFRLPDTTAGGKEVALDDFSAAPALLVAFICNHCPFVQHVAGELAALSHDLPADEDQSVAQAYRAACTPDLFLFDGDHKLVYRGQLDASRPGNGLPVTGSDLRAAVSAVLAGEPVAEDQRPSLGCNIKWKPATSRNTSADQAGRQRSCSRSIPLCGRSRRGLHQGVGC